MTPTAYMQAAQSIYEPQKQAEATALTAVRDTTKNSLEAQKGQVNTSYQQAIDKLTLAVQDQSSQINQLYTQRLSGNFSGLQGNDMGNMFSRANQQQGYIESTRANKINEITTGETNADINYNAGIASLTPKYQSLETQYAQDAYGSAVKAQREQANSDRSYNLSVAKLGISQQDKANKAAQDAAGKYKVNFKNDAGQQGDKSYEGPNGSTNLFQYAAGINNGDQGATWSTIKTELSSGSSTDKKALQLISNLEKQGKSQGDIVNRLMYNSPYSYIFK